MSSKAGAKAQAAYKHMKAVKESAYRQGLAGLPMYGEALRASNFVEEATSLKYNTFYQEYQRGLRDRAAQ
jgi:hypothetical protein